MLGICINLSQKNQEYLHKYYLPSVCPGKHMRKPPFPNHALAFGAGANFILFCHI